MQLPLFPYEIVLFPGIPQALHFFEPRYRQMCEDVIGADDSFGIVLARPESRFEEEVPEAVGTVARVVEHERLADGRWLVEAVGAARFRIQHLGPRRPYLTAAVELLDEDPGDNLRAFALRDAAEGKLRKLFALRTEAGPQPLPVTIRLNPDPGRASYQLAAIIGLDNRDKQRLLEIPGDDDRLAAELVLLDGAIDSVERELHEGMVPPPGGLGGSTKPPP